MRQCPPSDKGLTERLTERDRSLTDRARCAGNRDSGVAGDEVATLQRVDEGVRHHSRAGDSPPGLLGDRGRGHGTAMSSCLVREGPA